MATSGKLDLLKTNETESLRRKWIVIALSGVSSGGKTTIARKLLKSIPTSTIYISQDEYILPDDFSGHLKAPKPLCGYNKDSLDSIDMAKMIKDVKGVLSSDTANITVSNSSIPQDRKKLIGSALKSPRPPFHGCKQTSALPSVLMLDGFLLFNHPEVPPLCDLKYFITLTKSQCWDRRKDRIFTMPGMDGNTYFDHCMWPKYEEHFQEMCSTVSNVQFINGIHPTDNTFERIFNDLMKKLKG